MSRRLAALLVIALVSLTGCSALRSAPVDPQDPKITAEIDALLQRAMEGAAAADAEKVLAVAEGETDLSFITGDVILTGFDNVKDIFRDSYASVLRQDQTVYRKEVRVLSPEVAILYLVGEGIYTDVGGVTSSPIGLGLTLVLVKRDGEWRVTHAHQSFLN